MLFTFLLATSRASAWAREQGDPQDEGRQEDARPPEGHSKNTRNGPRGGGLVKESAGSCNAVAHDGTSMNNGAKGGDGDKVGAAKEGRTMRDSTAASDAQKLTSEFAAGRLTAPHFFGAMLVSCRGCYRGIFSSQRL